MKTKTKTLILARAMSVLAVAIQSDDGVANAAIAEAAERLEELHEENKRLKAEIEELKCG
jgi:cell division protein FtsB